MITHIETQRTCHRIPIAATLRALGRSRSWFHKRSGAEPTAVGRRRGRLDERIVKIFAEIDGTYGSPRIHAEPAECDEHSGLSANTVAARISHLGLCAKRPRRRCSLTKPEKDAGVFPNLLKREFRPAAPNLAFCGEITEVKARAGPPYLASPSGIINPNRRLDGRWSQFKWRHSDAPGPSSESWAHNYRRFT